MLVTSVMMIVLYFIGMTKPTSINLRKVKVGVSRADSAPKKYSGRPFRGEREAPEESSEITKASVIDPFLDWSSPVRIRSSAKRACRCFGGGQFVFRLHVFIPLLDHILPTTRFMTRTLLHSISETVLSRVEDMLSKSPSIWWLILIRSPF